MLTQGDIKVIEEIVEEKIGERTRLLPTKEEFFSAMDKLMGEIKSMREEFSLHFGRHEEINDTLENHGKRIKKLKHVASIT